MLWIFGFAFVRMWNRTFEFYWYDLVEVLDESRESNPPRRMSVQDSPQSSDSYMSVRSMVYWAIRLQSVLGSVCVMSRVGFHSVSLVLLISCLHALAGVRQPIIHGL